MIFVKHRKHSIMHFPSWIERVFFGHPWRNFWESLHVAVSKMVQFFMRPIQTYPSGNDWLPRKWRLSLESSQNKIVIFVRLLQGKSQHLLQIAVFICLIFGRSNSCCKMFLGFSVTQKAICSQVYPFYGIFQQNYVLSSDKYLVHGLQVWKLFQASVVNIHWAHLAPFLGLNVF